MKVDYDKYNALNFTCKQCSWQGKGEELVHGDFSELHSIGDLECPKCGHLIAFWKAPLTDKNKEDK